MSTPRPAQRFVATATRKVMAIKLVRAVAHYITCKGPTLADSVAYRTLFSVFAGVLLGFSVLAVWLAGDTEAWESIVATINGAIPGLISENGIIKPESITTPITFRLTGVASLVGLVIAALGAISALRVAIRTLAHTVNDDVAIVWVILRNLALAVGIGLTVGVAAWLTFSGRLGVTWATDLFGISRDSAAAQVAFRGVSIAVTFLLDVAIIAGTFSVLSGRRVHAKSLVPGLLLGGVGLVILQELSGLFVGGASANPLLASFASLLALLLWFHLSVQVILIAVSYIVVGATDTDSATTATDTPPTRPAAAVTPSQP